MRSYEMRLTPLVILATTEPVQEKSQIFYEANGDERGEEGSGYGGVAKNCKLYF